MGITNLHEQHKYDIMLSIIIGVILVTLVSQLYNNTRVMYVYK